MYYKVSTLRSDAQLWILLVRKAVGLLHCTKPGVDSCTQVICEPLLCKANSLVFMLLPCRCYCGTWQECIRTGGLSKSMQLQ